MQPSGPRAPEIGVIVVSYGAADVIAHCLESLCAAGTALRIVVVDNASPDATVATIRDWASGRAPYVPPGPLPFAMAPVAKPVRLDEDGLGPEAAPPAQNGTAAAQTDPAHRVTLLHSGANLGFAGGVNIGLAWLARDPAIRHFWVLNPDCMVPAASVSALQDRLAQLERGDGYGMLGGRLVYLEDPDRIQSDGGLLNRWTGVTGNANLGRSHASSPPPQPEDLDFIGGASMVVSRAFYDAVGPMPEDYFLYYEEVEWALSRGPMPLIYCGEFLVYHWGGTAIGSPIAGRPASPFSLYFKHRARMRFLKATHPRALPVGHAYSFGQAARLLLRRAPREAGAVLAGGLGLRPPAAVRTRLGAATDQLVPGLRRRREGATGSDRAGGA